MWLMAMADKRKSTRYVGWVRYFRTKSSQSQIYTVIK